MNGELFNFRRFALLLRKEWSETWRAGYYARLWAPLLAIMVLNWSTFISSCNHRMEALKAGAADTSRAFEFAFSDMLGQVAILSFVFLLFAATSFSRQLATPKLRVRWLTTPASTLEKYLVALLTSVLYVAVLFPASFMVSEVLRVAVCSVLYPQLDIPWMNFAALVGHGAYSLAGDWETFWVVVSCYILCFSLFVFGSTLWPKGAFIKTVGAISLVGALFLWGAWMLIRLLFTKGMEGCVNVLGLFTSVEICDNLTPGEAQAIFHCMLGLVSLFFLVMSYYRMKEMELINRW